MPPPRDNTAEEFDAFDATCERLSGFGADAPAEWVDGFFTALLAGRRTVMPSEWLPVVFGDAFGRAFADPADVQQAMQSLMARWNVIASQLDPQSLVDAPDDIRLLPLMMDYDDEVRRTLVEQGTMTEQEATDHAQTGALWAQGFVDALDALPDDWPEPDMDTEDGAWYDQCLTRVLALLMPAKELAEYAAEAFAGEGTPTRDDLIADACLAVQDLRVYWLDHAPRPATRRVEATPGRNDPCPCGSGLKYKKCHGAL